MKIVYLTAAIALSFLAVGCNHHVSTKKTDSTQSTPKDTSQSFKTNKGWVTLKPFLEFNTLAKDDKDTLDIVVCGDYVYSPFGDIKDKADFNSSLLKNFSVTNRVYLLTEDSVELNILTHKQSRLMFFFTNDPEASRGSFIVKGEIYDSDVNFDKGIKIGLSQTEFYHKLFSSFPEGLENRYKVIALESCVVGMRHIYTFETGKLKSVMFRSDYTIKADY